MDKGTDKITSGTNMPFWIESIEPIAFNKLTKNKKTTVVVVGGGIAGVSIACRLSIDGLRVILVDDGNIGSGETGRTTAHLVSALDDRYYDLEKTFGKDGAGLAAKSHSSAIKYVSKMVEDYHIDCEFEYVPGYLFLDPSDKKESLEKEYLAAKEAGVQVKLLHNVPGLKKYAGPCIEFSQQAKFHPLKYLRGLCDIIIKSGNEIYTNTHISEIKPTMVITEEGHEIEADYIVLATNSPVSNKYNVLIKQFPFRTYVIAAKIKKDSVLNALYWDTGNFDEDSLIPPYHYVRTQLYDSEYDLLICGGEDHQSGLISKKEVPEEKRYELLETWMRRYFAAGEIIYKWSGEVLETMDGLAHIGINPGGESNMYIVTGDSGNGMTHGIISSFIIPDLIEGKTNEYSALYDPSRLHLFSGSGRWVKEFLGGFIEYKKEILHNTEADLVNLKVNEGTVITIEKKKIAVYKDERNHLHFLDAECTHLGCIVKWNNDEKSWDCPCHGSRFSFDGKVVMGPAIKNLPHREIEID